MGDGRHRAPHRRRQGVPRRRARRVQPPGRGLVDRRSHPRRARRRRLADGHLAPPATRRARPSPTPITAPVHVLGVRAPPPRRRAARLDGLHRRLLRQQRRRELLRHACNSSSSTSTTGTTRQQLALAIFDWIEAWYNPRRRHSYCDMLSPIDYERATSPPPRGMIPTTNPRAHRRVANAARSSSEKSCGSSQAAKWPPLSTSLK